MNTELRIVVRFAVSINSDFTCSSICFTGDSAFNLDSSVLAPESSPLVSAAGIDFSAINSEGFIIKSSGGATFIHR